MSAKTTPIMRQYLAAKAAYPDAIVFFRLGDFYEMFNEDAVEAARVLDLTLTSRNKGAVDEVPMAGVPHHAAHGYVAKLLAKGYKVALCEQMADPSKTRGIVPREVVRVITPGLVTDGEQIDARENVFLAAVDGDAAPGLALLDLSTGELRATAVDGGASLLAELARAAPREILFGSEDAALRASIAAALPGAAIRADAELAPDLRESLGRALDDETITRASRELPPAAMRAAARAVRFAAACSPGASIPIRRLEAFRVEDSLVLDEVAQRHLELVVAADGGKKGSLLALVDATETPGGARLLRRRLLAPLLDVARIRRRLDEVELFVTHPAARGELRAALARVGDLERLGVRAAMGEATPRDLGALRDTLLAVPDVARAAASIPEPAGPDVLGTAAEPLDVLPDLSEALARALVDRPPALAREGGIFREGYDADLDEVRALGGAGTTKLAELEARLRGETGATTLKVKYTRVFGWYIEVTGKHLGKVPKEWRRKQTVAGAERFTNDELDDLSDKILSAEDRAREIEGRLLRELVGVVAKEGVRLHRLAARLADWDVAAALADVAHRHDYTRPEVDDGTTLSIVDGRHPVVERLAAAGQFVPNDVELDADEERLWLVTGPNMAGKSTLMRQVALIVILGQMGSYVPARQARIGVVDRVLSRVGASDNVSRGESTFMVEMRETSAILRAATRRSLVILDEIGRGTSTYDGLSIAWAVAEHLHDVTGCRALFATHYHELTELPKLLPHAANTSVSARELGDDVVFLHKLTRGAASRSYGLAVARLAGLPEPVLARARAILGTLEGGGALPSGGHATVRGRGKSGKVQLDLFAAPPEPVSVADHPALGLLSATDPNRLTPMDALALVAKLRSLLPTLRAGPAADRGCVLGRAGVPGRGVLLDRAGAPPMSIYEPVAALVRDELGELSSYHPHPGDFAVRLDANEAPDLFSEAAKARLAAAAVEGALSRYPDTRALALKDAIAARVGARADELLVGVGSDEVIALLLTALDKPRTRGRATIVTISPTFVMYRVSARARGLGVVEVPLDATWNLSVPAMKKAIEMAQPNLVFVASPNNPTGNAMRTEDLRALIEASHGALVLLDEAYVAYASSDLRALFEAYPNVALLGTLSKIGLAALRVGWLRAAPALVREVDKVRQPYNLPAVCQRMATVALTELAHELDRTIADVIGERGRLSEEITRLGHVVTPSDANFLWVRTERPAGEIWEHLAQQGVLVRSFHERGGRLANQLRVTVGTPAENDRFLEALASCR